MSQQLIYTSAPFGLKPGTRGFTTVAATRDLSPPVAARLESLSAYRLAFNLSDERVELNPVNFSHCRISVAGQTLTVLSRIAAAGADYSGRSNYLAHHLVLDANELRGMGPAELLADSAFWLTKWEGEPRYIDGTISLPNREVSPKPCEAWRRLTHDSGWGGALAQAFAENPKQPVYVVFNPGTDVLSLFAESLALVPTEKRWQVTFSTYYTVDSPDVDCLWRGVLADSPAAVDARSSGALVIDLTQPLSPLNEGVFADAARRGVFPKLPELPVAASDRVTDAVLESTVITGPVPSVGDGHHTGDIDIEATIQQTPTPPPGATLPSSDFTSLTSASNEQDLNAALAAAPSAHTSDVLNTPSPSSAEPVGSTIDPRFTPGPAPCRQSAIQSNWGLIFGLIVVVILAVSGVVAFIFSGTAEGPSPGPRNPIRPGNGDATQTIPDPVKDALEEIARIADHENERKRFVGFKQLMAQIQGDTKLREDTRIKARLGDAIRRQAELFESVREKVDSSDLPPSLDALNYLKEIALTDQQQATIQLLLEELGERRENETTNASEQLEDILADIDFSRSPDEIEDDRRKRIQDELGILEDIAGNDWVDAKVRNDAKALLERTRRWLKADGLQQDSGKSSIAKDIQQIVAPAAIIPVPWDALMRSSQISNRRYRLETDNSKKRINILGQMRNGMFRLAYLQLVSRKDGEETQLVFHPIRNPTTKRLQNIAIRWNIDKTNFLYFPPQDFVVRVSSPGKRVSADQIPRSIRGWIEKKGWVLEHIKEHTRFRKDVGNGLSIVLSLEAQGSVYRVGVETEDEQALKKVKNPISLPLMTSSNGSLLYRLIIRISQNAKPPRGQSVDPIPVPANPSPANPSESAPSPAEPDVNRRNPDDPSSKQAKPGQLSTEKPREIPELSAGVRDLMTESNSRMHKDRARPKVSNIDG